MTQASNLAKGGTNFNSTGNLSLTTGVTGTLPVANGGTGVTTSTGSGAVVLATSPTVTTPTIDKINTSVANTSLGAGNASIMKNRIINGAMVISQRNGTSSVTPTNGLYVLDRFQYNLNQASKFTTQQSTTAPAGFVNSLLVTSSSAYSLGAGDYFTVTQPIEGYNVADLGWGTVNAKTVTLSAWVYSSLTGTFGGSLMNGAFNYAYPFTYTISSANTWTQISVTVAGPTAGTWPTDNSSSLQVNFGLGVGTTYSGTAGAWTGSLKFSATGATSVVGTNGATFYITGVQLEVGSSATGFEYVNYQTSLANCQRYCLLVASGSGANLGTGMTYNSSNAFVSFSMPVTMRTAPTLQATTGTNYYTFYYNATAANFNTLDISGSSTNQSVEFYYGGGVSGGGYGVLGRTNDAGAKVLLLAEL